MERNWYLKTSPRRFGSHFTVQRVGRFPDKRDWVNNRFDTINYSFILGGRGEYHLDGAAHTVVAPCVIMQWTEHDFCYGPDSEWDELFVCFAPHDRENLARRGLFDTHRPVWHLLNPTPVLSMIDTMQVLLDRIDEPFLGDRIDLLAESVVMESLMAVFPPALRQEDVLVRQAASLMANNLAQPFDFAGFAARNGVHPATLRRRWDAWFRQSPLQYLMELRMQRACHLLAGSTMHVKQVGHEVGFADQLYFSRYFKRRIGVSPKRYRERLRDPSAR